MNLVTVLILWIFSLSALAESVSSCRTFTRPLEGGYCVYPGEGAKKDELVYYFHGMGESQRVWEDSTSLGAALRKEWQNRQVNRPTVVSVSFGSVWLMDADLLHFFTIQVLPRIESEMGWSPSTLRHFVGTSMGGFNVVQILFHSDIADKAAVLCAPMTKDLTPFADQQEVAEYVRHSRALALGGDEKLLNSRLKLALDLARAYFSNPEEWQSADPIWLASGARARMQSQIFVSASEADEFVLWEGNVAFVDQLKKRGANVNFSSVPGRHCSVDAAALGKFLVP